MLKSMPKISGQCIMAIIEKAGQRPPSEFAADFMAHLVESDQQDSLTALMAVSEKLSQGDAEVGLKIIASVGIFWKQIEATIEAEEMNEAWLNK
tara:strand:+ start:247 stop:528 length:282 start_codon:yes stop_codon:yes gene_type:complete